MRQPAPGGRVHVVGAGMAGLAAAVDLAGQGHTVKLYESGTHAGGRCRSFVDSEIGVRIDNGNHLLLSGNTAALDYIGRIGALDTFEAGDGVAIPFVDLSANVRWTVRPSQGRIPWWVLRETRRIPDTRARDYLGALALRRAAPDDTVAATLPADSALHRRLWEPLTVAVLNTAAADASAGLLWRVLAETIARGATACRPLVAREGLSESLVDPAVAFLARHGCMINFGSRLKTLAFDGDRIIGLTFDDAAVAVAPGDSVVLAVPAAAAARIVPGLVVPDDYAPIVNAHFRYPPPPEAPLFLGIVGGTAEWVFPKREVLSVTVSAADRLIDEPAAELRDRLWQDVTLALALPLSSPPPTRIVKERRATFRATPAQLRRRPPSATQWNNLHLAGDYVETGLPATIEGAIRSGFAAAARVRLGRSPTAMASRSSPVTPFPRQLEDRRRALP